MHPISFERGNSHQNKAATYNGSSFVEYKYRRSILHGKTHVLPRVHVALLNVLYLIGLFLPRSACRHLPVRFDRKGGCRLSQISFAPSLILVVSVLRDDIVDSLFDLADQCFIVIAKRFSRFVFLDWSGLDAKI